MIRVVSERGAFHEVAVGHYSKNLLLLSCGLMMFGLTGLIGILPAGPPGGLNSLVGMTIANTGTFVGAALLYVSAFSASVGVVWRVSRQRRMTLILCYLGLLVFTGWLAITSLPGAAPPFFIQGPSPTPPMQVVLVSTVVLLAISSQLFMAYYLKSKLNSVYWYSLALAMITLGQASFLVPRPGPGPVSWTGALAMFLGGVYFLPAVVDAIKSTHSKGIELEQAIVQFFRDAEENYRALTETAPDAIVSFDSNGRILLWNAAAERLFGHNRREATGSSVFDLIIPDKDVDHVTSVVRDLSASGTRRRVGRTVEMEAKRKHGEVFPIELSVSVRETAGGATSTAIIRDISERKQMEERLLQAERLAAIGKTTAMVGHDLRNPLRGMTTMLYLAKQALKSRKAAGKREMAGLLDTLDGQTAYMEKIVADLQDYARPLTPKLVKTSLTDLIRDTLSTMKVPRNVKVSVQVEKGIGKVLVDAGLMRRVLTNLTTNSIQSMPKGGKLTIRADKTPDATVIAVEDTGVGMPEEDLGRLFEPFFTTKAKGQGFGLPVCKRLVEAHGGTITAKSTPGKGSTFTIQIPVNKKR